MLVFYPPASTIPVWWYSAPFNRDGNAHRSAHCEFLVLRLKIKRDNKDEYVVRWIRRYELQLTSGVGSCTLSNPTKVSSYCHSLNHLAPVWRHHELMVYSLTHAIWFASVVMMTVPVFSMGDFSSYLSIPILSSRLPHGRRFQQES